MPSANDHEPAGAILVVGASRGLGCALAAEFIGKGWRVVATAREPGSGTPLDDLAAAHGDRIEIERLDITEPGQIAALRDRFASRRFDMLFVNAGTANARDETVAEVSTEEFVRVMVTNALSPMRVVEALQDLVAPDGLIGIMSSGQGSIANNERGGYEIYRSSKSALNQLMRSYAARHAGDRRALVLIAPGWVRTALGGPDAPLGIEDSIPKVANVLLAVRGRPGLRYLDRDGQAVRW